MSELDRLLKSSGVVIRAGSPADGDVPRVFLHAGRVFVSAEPAEVTTILGSCVATCIWDPAAGVGGINHYMLARDIGSHYETPRYARFAMTLLLEQLSASGAQRHRLRAKIFGGACILTASADPTRDLGTANVHAAKERLHQERIPVVEEDTGGTSGRKLVYWTSTGESRLSVVSRVLP